MLRYCPEKINQIAIKNVIFDFDGTLGDSKECGIIAVQKAFVEHGIDVPSAQQIEHCMGIPIEEALLLLSNQVVQTNELDNLSKSFKKYYKKYEDEILEVFPGIKNVLQTLYKKSLALFIVSSKDTDVLKRNLVSLGINDYFIATIGSGDVTKHKPLPEGINYIIDTYQINRQETIMVGDATFDIQMGKAAQVKTCAVTWGSHSENKLGKEQPDFTAHQAEDILKIIL